MNFIFRKLDLSFPDGISMDLPSRDLIYLKTAGCKQKLIWMRPQKFRKVIDTFYSKDLVSETMEIFDFKTN